MTCLHPEYQAAVRDLRRALPAVGMAEVYVSEWIADTLPLDGFEVVTFSHIHLESMAVRAWVRGPRGVVA